jgi:hypothetical protein
LLIENLVSTSGLINNHEIINQQLLEAREEVRDRRNGESPLPPAAST